MFADVMDEVLPELAARFVDQHERDEARLAGLHQGDDFQGFVERAEAAGEGGDRAGLAQEGELAGEEIAEGDELGVVADDLVGVLLEGQQDVEAEAFFRARALLRRAHDAVARAGDGHVVRLRS